MFLNRLEMYLSSGLWDTRIMRCQDANVIQIHLEQNGSVWKRHGEQLGILRPSSLSHKAALCGPEGKEAKLQWDFVSVTVYECDNGQ